MLADDSYAYVDALNAHSAFYCNLVLGLHMVHGIVRGSDCLRLFFYFFL